MERDALSRLVALEGDLESLLVNAKAYVRSVRDSERHSEVQLRVEDLERALNRFESRALSGKGLQEWAEFLELNEQVEYEPGQESVIADVLFRLATPEINEPITAELVRRLRSPLSRKGRGG